MKKNTNKLEKFVIALLLVVVAIIGIFSNREEIKTDNVVNNTEISYDISNIPQYNGNIYVKINDNVPTFSSKDMNIVEDYYSSLKNGKVRNSYDKN